MKNLTKIFFVMLLGIFVSISFAQEENSTEKKESKECAKDCCSGHESKGSMTMAHMEADSTHSMHHQMKSDQTEENSIVREGEIDLQSIDKNQDGKVYQDMMDWYVISDDPGKCPLCGMTLKEVTLEKAKENLIKHDYKVKENK